jgi:hypothetical protein
MKDPTSREAADQLGISVQRWHRLAERFQLKATRELPGLRGAKFWRPQDVRTVGRFLAAEQPDDVEVAS